MPKQIEIWKVPLTKLFIDSVEASIFANNVRKPHGIEGPGYQRDPYRRLRWIRRRAEHFAPQLMRPVEVSPRPDGTLALIDGGGRFLMAELAGLKEIEARVHVGLTRAAEAELFEQFDAEIYKLRPIEKFQAAISAGNPLAIEISDAIAPYRIANHGKGTMKCVGQLMAVHHVAGTRLIMRVARIVANAWSGYNGPGDWTSSKRMEGKNFLAVAILVDVADKRFDEGRLRTVLSRMSQKELEGKVNDELQSSRPPIGLYARAAAKLLARKYNHSFPSEKRVLASDIDNSELVEAILESPSYASLMREASDNPKPAAKKERDLAPA